MVDGSALIIRPAAGDVENRAGAEGTILRRQPGRQRGDLRRLEQASELHTGLDPGLVFGRQVVEQFGIGAARGDAIDQDAGLGGVYDLELMQRYIALGMQFILCGNDLSMLMAAARERVQQLRN